MSLLMDDKKNKKKALNQKNRRQQEIFQAMRLRQLEAERVEDLKEGLKPSREETQDEKEIWSAKVGQIRNRLTGQKRDAQERWNRFAGTSDGGGRGL